MPNRNRELGTAILGGLVACGMVTTALDLAEVSFSTIIGAVVGGLAAAYLLYGKMSQATIAGALSGVLAIPFLFGVSEILLIFEVIPIPSVPNPPLSQIQEQVAAIVLTNLIAGAIGGAILSAVHHPPKALPPPPPPPGSAAGPVRYCVQCGAQLPSGAMICTHCNARQPQ
jgi:hypothetical protein